MNKRSRHAPPRNRTAVASSLAGSSRAINSRSAAASSRPTCGRSPAATRAANKSRPAKARRSLVSGERLRRHPNVCSHGGALRRRAALSTRASPAAAGQRAGHPVTQRSIDARLTSRSRVPSMRLRRAPVDDPPSGEALDQAPRWSDRELTARTQRDRRSGLAVERSAEFTGRRSTRRFPCDLGSRVQCRGVPYLVR